MDEQKLGFIGLGIMGSAMVKRLLKAGYSVSVYNRTQEKTKVVANLGATVAESVRDLSERCGAIILMLSDDTAIEHIVFRDGLMESVERGKTLINMSTISPDMTEKLAKAANERRVQFIDAPVSGSKPQAEAGELVILASGEKHIVEVMSEVLHTMGSKIIYAGEAGRGTLLKLAINLILAHLTAALSEGLAFATQATLQPSQVLEVLSNAPVLNAPFFQIKGKKIVTGDFSPQFPLRHMLKDVKLALKEARDTSTSLPVTEAIAELFTKASDDGHGDEDLSAIALLQLDGYYRQS